MKTRIAQNTPGFTLIEVLVVIAVVSVLVGLALPSLAKARLVSRQVKGTSNIRQLGIHVAAYSSDHNDLMPRIDPDAMYPVSAGAAVQFPYWQVDETWILVLHQQLPIWENAELIYCPSSRFRPPSETPRFTSYAMSWAFAAGPGLWRRTSPDVAALKYRVRQADIANPSHKALLWDVDAGYYGRTLRRSDAGVIDAVAVQMSDLSCSIRVPAEATAPVTNVLWFTPNAFPLRNTENGASGYDF